MADEESIREATMLASGVPHERAVAEVWVVPALERATGAQTSLLEAARMGAEYSYQGGRARACLIAALLVGAARGVSAQELHGEFLAAFGEVFSKNGSVRDLLNTYGYRDG